MAQLLGDAGLPAEAVSVGDYPAAIASINAGIKKGQVKRLDEAYVYLGLSLAALQDGPAAKQTFDQLKSSPGISRRVVDLWELYSETSLPQPGGGTA